MRIGKFLTRTVGPRLPVLFLASASIFVWSQATPSNVSHIDPAQLQLRWVFHSRNSTFSGALPTIAGNVIYVSTSSDIYAIDAISGGMIWHYVRQAAGSQPVAFPHITRSILIHDNSLYSLTEDAHFLALDTRSGNLLWDVVYSSSDSSCNNARTTTGTYDAETQTISWQLTPLASAQGGGCVITLDGATGKPLHPRRISSQMTPTAIAEQFRLADDPLVLTLRNFASAKTSWRFNLGQELESQTAGYLLDGKPLIVVTAGKDLFLFGQDFVHEADQPQP